MSPSAAVSSEAMAAPEIFTADLGQAGPRIVLMHGLFGSGKNWTGVAKALSSDYRVTLVDLPNHGRSGWTEHFSYVAMADALADRLADRLVPGGDGTPITLVGHSMGGKVAMVLALRHPDLVGRLVVVDVAPVRYERMTSFGRYVAGMEGLDLAATPDRAAADKALQVAVPNSGLRSFLLQNLRRDPTGGGWQWQLNLALLGKELAEIGDWPERAEEPYRGPVLWIAGADSDYVRPAYAPAMRRLFPRVHLVTVKKSGHWVHAEQPETFVAAIRAFVHPS